MKTVLDLRDVSVDLPLGGFLSRAWLPILLDVSLGGRHRGLRLRPLHREMLAGCHPARIYTAACSAKTWDGER